MRALGPSAKIAYDLASDIWGKIAMRRRQFIMLAGGAAATWPLGALAQQSERKRRVGVLMGLAADDAEAQDRIAAFEQGLQQSGWTKGHNLQIDYRRGAGDTNSTRDRK